jgi:hypothetical protein
MSFLPYFVLKYRRPRQVVETAPKESNFTLKTLILDRGTQHSWGFEHKFVQFPLHSCRF